ncbi:RHS repeat-associated core domain-containing protein [Alkalimonas sp. NCh-2]|uniref:RHS repeat-associated core domain-containing protein n=1 Tax=Alkalimonas sp. NCh-2 TaxID=3144846 RepID=UPI0031F6CBEA
MTSVLTLRDLTGHEQIDDVGLIHMGGRVYDPILGRFLQADPFIQQPNNIQNFNRYSYVLNNPLNATDPSGYFFQLLVIWAVNYIAAATLTGAAFTAFTMAMTAYQYYGYAQMAVGAMRAIDGGGTAMANFAGGMAKGYAKGLAFNAAMGGLMKLGQGQAAADSPNAPQPVNGEQGTASSDGHERNSADLDGKGPNKVTAVTQGKSLKELQHGLQVVNDLLGNDDYDANSVVKAANDFLQAIRRHPHANELTSLELELLRTRADFWHSQAATARYSYNAIKYGSLVTGFTVYESLSRAELAYGTYQDGITAKNVTGGIVEAMYSAISRGAKHPVVNAIGAGVSEVINRMPWEKKNDK